MNNKYLLLADGNSPHILKWIKELEKHFDLYLISLNGVDVEVYKYIKKNKVFVLNKHTNAAGGNHKLILKIFKIRKLIKEINPDYLNAHYLSSYGFLAALSKGVSPHLKLIQSTWGSDILLEPFKNIVKKKVAQYSLGKADYVTSDSYYMSDIVGQLVPKKDVIVFPFGFIKIDTATIKKEKLIFSNRALKVFYNIDKILRWFQKQDNTYRLVIANDGDESDALKTLAKELNILNRVDFVGYLTEDEQTEYYQKSLYYISIPNSDATSVSLLEAMQYGAIPIVSNIPANREWILDGVNGAYFDANIMLYDIQVEEDFVKINQNILTNKALFPKCIQEFVTKVS
ncbi:MAG: glycosyltransferase [Sulfurovum sp.]|nr:glycosyltransferase [Sulfurovum sp.]